MKIGSSTLGNLAVEQDEGRTIPVMQSPQEPASEPSASLPAPTAAEVLEEIRLGGDPVPTDRPEPPEPTEGSLSDQVARERDFEWLKAFKAHHGNKKCWSWFMMAILTTLVVFQIFLLIMVGNGSWDFTKYEWLLPILLVQNFAQIIGLAHVVVKSLFDGFKE